ncbi:MAG: hypothetical protein H6Q73_3779 [Firmicutes bacterium]|nr:hypothetical protein [Bacillota bacterium]
MMVWNKKTVLGLITGTFLLSNALTPLAAQASERVDSGKHNCSIQQRHLDPEKSAQRLTDTYGVNKQDVLKYQQDGVKMPDLARASVLAKASGRSLKDIMAAKTYDNTWKDVAQAFGITKEKIKAVHQEITAVKLEQTLKISKQTSLNLMHQGYRPYDIAIANELAKDTRKSTANILALKKINNTWLDVAQSIGVREAAFNMDMQAVKAAFPRPGSHKPQHQPNGYNLH